VTDRRLLALLVPLVVPWTVQVFPDQLFFVFPWGLASSPGSGVVLLDTYLFERTAGFAGLPRRLQAWPVSTVLYACAVAVAAVGPVAGARIGALRESRVGLPAERLAALGFAAAALVHLRVTLGLFRLGSLAVPTGPAVLLAIAWWVAGWDRAPDGAGVDG